MALDELRRLQFPQGLLGGAADVVVVHFQGAQGARRVDDESAAQREAFVTRERQIAALYQHAECVRYLAGRVGAHRILYLLDSLRGVVPGLVHEDGVGREGHDVRIRGRYLRIQFGQVLELRRADEGEVRRIEDDDEPLATEIENFIRFTSSLWYASNS